MRILLMIGMIALTVVCKAQSRVPLPASGQTTPQPSDPAKQPPKEQGKEPLAKEQEAKQEPGKQADKQPPEQGEKKQDEQKEAAQEEEEEPKERKPLFNLEGGWADWGLSGQERKFRQYATPPRGWFLRDFRLAPFLQPNKMDAFATVKSPGLPDYFAEGRVALQYGGTYLSGMLSNNQFYAPATAFIPLSERGVDGMLVRQALHKNVALSLRYRTDDQKQFFEPPLDPLNQHTRFRDLTASGRIGPGFASFSLLDWHYRDLTPALPSTTTEGLRLGYLWEVNPNIGIETAFTRLLIEQSEQATSRVDTIAVDGDFSLSPATDLQFSWRERNVDMPNVQNTWVRHQNAGSLRLGHHWKGWSGHIRFRLTEVERIRDDQTYVDVPKWFTFDGRLSGRLARNLRVTLWGSTQSLSDPPVMTTQDPRSLYFDGRDQIQFKLDGGWSSFNGYLTYAYRQWRNGARSIDVTNHNITVGGDWQVSSPLNLFAEYSHENWSGKTDVTEFPTLDNFAPDSDIFVVGVNWTLNERTFLSLSYSEFWNANDNPLLLAEGNTGGRFFTLNGRYQFPSGMELGLLLSPQAFRDRVVNTRDYDATVVMITAAARF